MSQAGMASVESAIREVSAGRLVVVVDHQGRKNEGGFIMAAQHADAKWPGLVIRDSSGPVCAAIDSARADALGLPLMVQTRTGLRRMACTGTINVSEGIRTGGSGADRAQTFNSLADTMRLPPPLFPTHRHGLPVISIADPVTHRLRMPSYEALEVEHAG